MHRQRDFGQKITKMDNLGERDLICTAVFPEITPPDLLVWKCGLQQKIQNTSGFKEFL